MQTPSTIAIAYVTILTMFLISSYILKEVFLFLQHQHKIFWLKIHLLV